MTTTGRATSAPPDGRAVCELDQRFTGRRRERAGCGDRGLTQPFDLALDRGQRTGSYDDVADPGTGARLDGGISQCGAHDRTLGVGRPFERLEDQHRALALAEVV